MRTSGLAETRWPGIASRETCDGKNSLGPTRKKLQRFEGHKKAAKATTGLGRVSAAKRKNTLEHMMTKERQNVPTHAF